MNYSVPYSVRNSGPTPPQPGAGPTPAAYYAVVPGVGQKGKYWKEGIPLIFVSIRTHCTNALYNTNTDERTVLTGSQDTMNMTPPSCSLCLDVTSSRIHLSVKPCCCYSRTACLPNNLKNSVAAVSTEFFLTICMSGLANTMVRVPLN